MAGVLTGRWSSISCGVRFLWRFWRFSRRRRLGRRRWGCRSLGFASDAPDLAALCHENQEILRCQDGGAATSSISSFSAPLTMNGSPAIGLPSIEL